MMCCEPESVCVYPHDGARVSKRALYGCATEDCASEHEWPGDIDLYAYRTAHPFVTGDGYVWPWNDQVEPRKEFTTASGA